MKHMKHFWQIGACAALALLCAVSMAACDQKGDDTGTTAASSEVTTAAVTEATTAVSTVTTPETTAPETTAPETTAPETTAPETTAAGGGEAAAGDEEYDPETYIVIRNVDDLLEFNRKVNVDMEFYSEMTVIFLDDIDLSGHPWTPLDGTALEYITFDGQGHTISHMDIVYNEANEAIGEEKMGCGFIDVAVYPLTFQNITFDQCTIKAYERHVGCLVGKTWGGDPGMVLEFNNVKVTNFTADGWVYYNMPDPEGVEHPISFRVAGFVGANFVGQTVFENCVAENLKLSGFHNLAGFLGYDASRSVDEFCFTNCTVKNAEMVFSYCLAPSYKVDQPRKFVSVFFNSGNWADNIDYCVEVGNTYSGVTYYDFADENHPYDSSEFRSWTREEADAAAAG